MEVGRSALFEISLPEALLNIPPPSPEALSFIPSRGGERGGSGPEGWETPQEEAETLVSDIK